MADMDSIKSMKGIQGRKSDKIMSHTLSESGACAYQSSFLMSPLSVMPATPSTPATPLVVSPYSPMAMAPPRSVQVHSNYTQYSESEDEDDSPMIVDEPCLENIFQSTEKEERCVQSGLVQPPPLTIEPNDADVGKSMPVHKEPADAAYFVPEPLRERGLNDVPNFLGLPPSPSENWKVFDLMENDLVDEALMEIMHYKDRPNELMTDLRNFTETALRCPDTMEHFIQTVNIVPTSDPTTFIWDGIEIQIAIFLKAWNEYTSDDGKEGGPQKTEIAGIKSATTLFLLSLFTENELKQCTLSGKRKSGKKDSENKLDPIRILAIQRIIMHFKYLKYTGKIFQIPENSTCFQNLQVLLTPEERKVLDDVFCHGRNQIFQKKRRQTGNCNPSLNQNEHPASPLVETRVEWTDGEYLTRRQWAEIFINDKETKAAAVAFQYIFTEEEIATCTWRGDNGKERLNRFKCEAIYEITYRLRDKTVYPYNFQKIPKTANFESACPEKLKKEIKQSVFVQLRSQLAQGAQKKSKVMRMSQPNLDISTAPPLQYILPAFYNQSAFEFDETLLL